MSEVSYLVFLLWAASLSYILFAIYCVTKRNFSPLSPDKRPPVTILKPLCGQEQGLLENLRSFCQQNYPDFQIVFGVGDSKDPVIATVRQLIKDFPEREIVLVINDFKFGSNPKVSNLINMYGAAKHDLIVIADSDMRVGGDYLDAVISEFSKPSVGAVTCLYRGIAAEGYASRLGAMFINEGFLPSVLVALALGDLRFCFGSTMAVRRSVLEKMGGFPVLSRYLADDHMLGKLVSELGFEVRLCPYVIDNIVYESSYAALIRHELRWARTVRTVQPVGYALSFVTYLLPMSILVGIGIESFFEWGMLSCLPVLVALILRIILHYVVNYSLRINSSNSVWLVPIRDILSFGIWAVSFFGGSVQWKNQALMVKNNGQLTT